MYKVFNIFFLTLGMVYSQNIDSLFSSGNDSYNKNQFDVSVIAYENILSQGFYSADLYYNLGNAYFRLDSLGFAIWAYSKALQISPRDKNCIYNLNLTKERLNVQITYPKNYLLVSMLFKIRNNITFNELIFLSSLITVCLFIFNFINEINIFNVNFKKKLFKTSVFLAIFLHTLSIDSYFLKRKEEAILIKEYMNIFSEPFSSNGNVVAVVNEGAKIQLLNFQGSWSEVLLDSGEKGWIPSSSYLELNK